MNILIIEDDKDISKMLEDFFIEKGYNVEIALDGKMGLEKFQKATFDILLLDLMLPQKSGSEVLIEIRKTSYIPIIVISAKESDFDKSLLLDIGADDYVTKPFSLLELNSRVKSALRRMTDYGSEQDNKKKILKHKDLLMDTNELSLKQKEKNILLTSIEFKILQLFLENPSKIFTKENLYESIWNTEYFGDEDVINTQISRLRVKLSEKSKNPKYIETIWGMGYRLKGD